MKSESVLQGHGRDELVNTCLYLAALDADERELDSLRRKYQCMTRDELIKIINDSPYDIPNREQVHVSIHEKPIETLTREELIELHLSQRVAVAHHEDEYWREIDRLKYKYSEFGSGLAKTGLGVFVVTCLYVYGGNEISGTWAVLGISILAMFFGFGARESINSGIRNWEDPSPSRVMGSTEEESEHYEEIMQKLSESK